MFRKISLATAAVLLIVLIGTTTALAYQVVVVKSADIAPYNEAIGGFKKTCGCSISEISLSDTDPRELRREVLGSQSSLIFAVGLDALTQTLAIRDMPLVYAMVPRPQVPGPSERFIAGVSMSIVPDKYLSTIQELFPAVKRIGVVYDPKNMEQFVREADSIAHKKGLELVKRRVTQLSEVPSAIDGIKKNTDIILMLPDTTVVNAETFKHMLDVSYQNSLPVFTFTKKYVEMGAAAGLYAAPGDMGIQAGEIAHRFLQEKPPLSQPRADLQSGRLIVNETIIRKLGTKVNNETLRRAGHVR
ncbi:MAG: ABC transporter substrate-binding protein [Thermodesulfovibrionales bacterium]